MHTCICIYVHIIYILYICGHIYITCLPGNIPNIICMYEEYIHVYVPHVCTYDIIYMCICVHFLLYFSKNIITFEYPVHDVCIHVRTSNAFKDIEVQSSQIFRTFHFVAAFSISFLLRSLC
jgi:hypothetical protein